jgi:hypothetical protein
MKFPEICDSEIVLQILPYVVFPAMVHALAGHEEYDDPGDDDCDDGELPERDDDGVAVLVGYACAAHAEGGGDD